MSYDGMILNLYDKQGILRALGNVGDNTVDIKGLNPGDKVQAGDYQIAYADIYGNVSDRVDVPAFTVNGSASPALPKGSAGGKA